MKLFKKKYIFLELKLAQDKAQNKPLVKKIEIMFYNKPRNYLKKNYTKMILKISN